MSNNELFNGFTFNSSAQAKRMLTNVISKHNGIAETTQKLLWRIGADIALHANTSRLTQLIEGLSEGRKDNEGKLILNAVRQYIGLYMSNAFPVKWDMEKQVFTMKKNTEEKLISWDYEKSFKMLKDVRYDRYYKSQKHADITLTVSGELLKLKAIVERRIKAIEELGEATTTEKRDLKAYKKAVGMETKQEEKKEKEGVVITGQGFLKDVVNG